MVLELDEDEAAIEGAIVRARIQVDVGNAVQYLGQLRHKLRLGLGLGHAAEEEAAVVHGLDHADAMPRPDLIAVEERTGLPRDPRLLVQRKRITARRPGKVEHQPQLQQPADFLQHRHQFVLVAVARQSAQENLRAFAALTLTERYLRRRQSSLAIFLREREDYRVVFSSLSSFSLRPSLFVSDRDNGELEIFNSRNEKKSFPPRLCRRARILPHCVFLHASDATEREREVSAAFKGAKKFSPTFGPLYIRAHHRG